MKLLIVEDELELTINYLQTLQEGEENVVKMN